MEGSAGKLVIEFQFEPVQQFPGQDDVGLGITVPLGKNRLASRG